MTQRRRWVCGLRASLLVLLLSGAALSGCVSQTPGPREPGVLEPTSDPDWASNETGLTVTLDDIPDGDDWAVIEARVPTNASIEPGDAIEVTTQLAFDPADSPEACFAIGAKHYGLQVQYLGSYAAVTVTPAREEPVYQHPTVVPGTGVTFNLSYTIPLPDDRHTYHLVSAANLAAWEPSKLEVETTVYEGTPVDWRIVDAGSTTCRGELFEHRRGEVVTAGVETVAWDLQDAFSLERYGWGSVFVNDVDTHDAELKGPNGTVWSSSTLAPTETGFLRAMPRGEYTFSAPHLTGSASAAAGWHVLDVPLWVSEMMSPDPSTT